MILIVLSGGVIKKNIKKQLSVCKNITTRMVL